MSKQLPKVLLQNLRDFTVQIRRMTSDAIVGTGIVVSMNGQIITCAHVVRDVLGVHPREANGAEVGVYFPQISNDEIKLRRAMVVCCFPEHDDDIVLLQLINGPTLLDPKQVAMLGTAEWSSEHDFRSYGYRHLGPYQAGYANGKIMGLVEPPLDYRLKADPIELRSRDIRQGMSGAAVLDVERNLVIGLIAQRWNPGNSPIDDNLGWAVDTKVLTFSPFNLNIQDAPFPLGAAPQFKTDIVLQPALNSNTGIKLHGAPPPLAEWVGREQLLQSISDDWSDPSRRVTGLIGFGGEGKSSLVRRWLDNLLTDKSLPQPDGVFWWTFYDKPSVDEFFEAALAHLSGGSISLHEYPSVNAKVHIIAALLTKGRFLFILDGIEVLQHQRGDCYGLLNSNNLRNFLSFFAAPEHESFCLITSRVPLLDLLAYTTYTHHDVDRLSPIDGRQLLRKLGVEGYDEELDKVVTDWYGHALTISLIGTYLEYHREGRVEHVNEIPAPIADEPHYERIHRVLHRYDKYLTEPERVFLMLFSAFRTPITEEVLTKLFRSKTMVGNFNAPLTSLDDVAFNALVEYLIKYRILRRDQKFGYYTIHPLISSHYSKSLNERDHMQCQEVHEAIKVYYLELAKKIDSYSRIEDVIPFIEATHHACKAGQYDEAYDIHWAYTNIGSDHVLPSRLGAFEAHLSILQDFFPGGDTSLEPQVTDPSAKRFILHDIGFCLKSLGNLISVPKFYERALEIVLDIKDWANVSIIYDNMAGLQRDLGNLSTSISLSHNAIASARRAVRHRQHPEYETRIELFELHALSRLAWTLYLAGRPDTDKTFQEADSLWRTISTSNYLFGDYHYVDYLRRKRKITHARKIVEERLRVFTDYPDELSFTHRLIGDLEAGAGRQDRAFYHYNLALKIARGIYRRDALIECLLAIGNWAARRGETELAESNLDEALDLAVAGGYRIYEADVRVSLAHSFYAAGKIMEAKQQATRAQRMSIEMDYHLRQAEASIILEKLDHKS